MITGIELAQKVIDHVKANPEKHYQGTWVTSAGSCGTAACLAGWCVLLNAEDGEDSVETLNRVAGELNVSGYYENVAYALLGLPGALTPTGEDDEQVLKVAHAFFTLDDNDLAIRRFADAFGLDA